MFFQVLMQQSKRSCQDVHKEDKGNYHTRYPSHSDTTTKEVFRMFLFLHQHVKSSRILYPHIYNVNKGNVGYSDS